ncbi:MAG: His/Gly/Thr/Pro-type tRNA ligase C-terminal domain-containing protein, partial [Microgenomates group bacterium]
SDIVLQEFLEEKNLLPELSTKSTKVLVTVFDQKTLGASIEITSVLRKANVFVELYPETEKKLEKQLKYADRNNIPYVLIIGPEEVEKNIYKLKDMKTKEQTTVSKDDLLKKLT